jgi:Ran GTPase-activating protein (RanGAP) involved in mRNA processing and transport
VVSTPEGPAAIAEALRFNAALTFMDISSNSLDDKGMRSIGNALLSSSTSKLGALKCDEFDLPVGVKSLNLHGKRISSAAATLLAGVVRFSAALTTLDLSYNNLCLEGVKALADALRVNAVLTTLNLRSNDLGPEGGKALVEALRVNAALTSLDLSGNKIGPEGGKALA